MKIEQKNNEKQGAFFAKDGDRIIGEMTYVWAGNDKIIINHTEVSPAYEGQGVGKLMVKESVAFARKNNIKIKPLCTFARRVFDRNPEYDDVRL